MQRREFRGGNSGEGMQAYKQVEHRGVTATPNIIFEKNLLRSDRSDCNLLNLNSNLRDFMLLLHFQSIHNVS